jgi:hypothetical protein
MPPARRVHFLPKLTPYFNLEVGGVHTISPFINDSGRIIESRGRTPRLYDTAYSAARNILSSISAWIIDGGLE